MSDHAGMVVLGNLPDSAAVGRPSVASRRGARALPAGAVTFFFTDIERSTKRVNALGAEHWEDALVGSAWTKSG
jgi:class 3 adenylate cyclase